RVDAAVYDPGAARARQLPHFVAATRIPGMNPDADHVAALDRRGVNRVERLVDDDWVAPFGAGCGGQHIQPSRGDDGHAKRHVAWVQEMDTSTHSSAGLSG